MRIINKNHKRLTDNCCVHCGEYMDNEDTHYTCENCRDEEGYYEWLRENLITDPYYFEYDNEDDNDENSGFIALA